MDASSAWQRIEDIRPDVVLLDVRMPAGNGLCVGEMMSQHDELKGTPLIVLTGKTDHQTIRRCHELMAFYVTKCDDVWSRIKPLLCDILENQQKPLSDEPQDPREHDVEVNRGRMHLMDAVFSSLETDGSETIFVNEVAETPWLLSIDDDEAFAHGLRLRLQEHGVEVVRASAGMEGYRRAFTTPAKVILLDYEMPDGNGDYVLGRLKDNPVTRDIPVIVLTGRREKALERKMYAIGADCFMTKPYSWPELWGEIQRYLPEGAIATSSH
jgi:CheY-like chemotaxis protein